MTSFSEYENELIYFDIPGKAEAIRLACNHASINLKDTRISRDKFMAMKSSGELKFGQVPYLKSTSNGTTVGIVQSCSILRFIGKQDKSGRLYPSDPFICSKVDSMLDQEADIFTGISVARYKERFGFDFLNTNEELVKEVYESIVDNVLPKHLHNLDRILADSSTGWFADTPEPTICDFNLAPRLKWLTEGIEGIPSTILNNYSNIINFMKKFYEELPSVVSYYNK